MMAFQIVKWRQFSGVQKTTVCLTGQNTLNDLVKLKIDREKRGLSDLINFAMVISSAGVAACRGLVLQ